MHRNTPSHDDESQPERVPSFLTARELQSRAPAKGESRAPAAKPDDPAAPTDAKPSRAKRAQP